jgi:O-antigen/teichoic acid export membrane protein
LVGTRILTGMVSPSVFGEANLLIGLATLGSNLFCAPLLHATARFYPDAERAGRVVSLRRLLVSFLLLATTLVLVLIVSGGVVWSVETNGSLPFACFLVLGALFAFDTARLFETNLLNAARRHSIFSLWSVADAWAKPFAAVAAAVLIAPTTLAMLSGYAVGTGAVLLLFRRTNVGRTGGNETSGGDAWSVSLRPNVLRYSAPMVPLAIIGWTSNLGDRYILAAYSGASAAGLYTAAYGLASQPFLMFSGIIGLTLRPVLFEAVAQDNRVRERRTILVWLAAVSLCSFVGVVAIWLYADPLVGLLLGGEFRGAAPILVWIAAAYALQGVQQVFETMLYAQRRTKSLVAIQSIATVFGLLLYFLLIPSFGAMGAAMGTCASLAVSGTASILFAKPWKRLRTERRT